MMHPHGVLEHVESPVADESGDPPEPMWRRALSLTFTLAVIALSLYLWPAVLGGSTRVIIVSGHSMEPTYALRDIVVTRDAGNTQIGDIVLFEVPEGEAEGMLVIHRVLKVDDEGFFIAQGDNRDTPDQWQLTEDDIVGKPLLVIPQGGKALSFIQNIWVISMLVGAVVLFLLWPDEEERRSKGLGDREPGEPFSDPTLRLQSSARLIALTSRSHAAAFVRDAVSVGQFPEGLPAGLWRDSPWLTTIDDEVMTEALSWLDDQLEELDQPVGV